MKKFPKINQYRQVVKSLRLQESYVGKDEEDRPIYETPDKYSTVEFVGYPKIHGTSGGVRVNFKTCEIEVFSRTQKLSENKDNAGFFKFVNERREAFLCWPTIYKSDFDEVILYGEWCGEEIQKGVAVNQLEKMFVLFGIKGINGEEEKWVDPNIGEYADKNLFNIRRCDGYHFNIDLNKPEEATNKMIEITDQIEKECPFAKTFGISDIGEGAVYAIKGYDFDTAFKVKGSLHSATKVKKLPKVDIEKLNSIEEFLDKNVTEERLQQAWDFISQDGEVVDLTKMGDFIRWMNNDIWEEEGDEAEGNNISRKEIGSDLSTRCVRWYKEKVFS